jgi:hypothetical protein
MDTSDIIAIAGIVLVPGMAGVVFLAKQARRKSVDLAAQLASIVEQITSLRTDVRTDIAAVRADLMNLDTKLSEKIDGISTRLALVEIDVRPLKPAAAEAIGPKP